MVTGHDGRRREREGILRRIPAVGDMYQQQHTPAVTTANEERS